MFESVHNKLIRKYKAYRDWHNSPASGIVNASLFLIFGIYMSSVMWVAANPKYFKEKEDLNVLGVNVGPSNLAYQMERNKITVSSVETKTQLSIIATTTKDSTVWVEYDNSADGVYLKTQKTSIGKTHLIDIWQYNVGETYVYRVGATDIDGYTVYSRIYSFVR